MAITDTLFNEQVGGGDFVASIGVPVLLEVRCPECGEPLRLGTLDLQTTGDYSIPFVICKNNCDPSTGSGTACAVMPSERRHAHS